MINPQYFIEKLILSKKVSSCFINRCLFYFRFLPNLLDKLDNVKLFAYYYRLLFNYFGICFLSDLIFRYKIPYVNLQFLLSFFGYNSYDELEFFFNEINKVRLECTSVLLKDFSTLLLRDVKILEKYISYGFSSDIVDTTSVDTFFSCEFFLTFFSDLRLLFFLDKTLFSEFWLLIYPSEQLYNFFKFDFCLIDPNAYAHALTDDALLNREFLLEIESALCNIVDKIQLNNELLQLQLLSSKFIIFKGDFDNMEFLLYQNRTLLFGFSFSDDKFSFDEFLERLHYMQVHSINFVALYKAYFRKDDLLFFSFFSSLFVSTIPYIESFVSFLFFISVGINFIPLDKLEEILYFFNISVGDLII